LAHREICGTTVGPQHGVTFESGIKGAWREGALNGYLAVYRVEQRDVPIATVDPSNTNPLCCYTSVAGRESGLVEYVYPLKTDGKATQTLEELSITADIKSQHGVSNVYSPTHSITLKRRNDKEVTVSFDKKQGLLDKDFQMFYQLGDKDVGLTAMTHRPVASEKPSGSSGMTFRYESSIRKAAGWSSCRSARAPPRTA